MVRHSVLAGALAFLAVGQPQQQAAAGQQTVADAQQQAIPDAPRPQATLPGAATVAPGSGTTADSNGDTSVSSDPDQPAPATSLQGAKQAEAKEDAGPPPDLPATGQGADAFKLVVNTNFVEVPFTVKDSKGRLVPGLTWRDVRVYENGYRQQMRLFTVDPFPLSVALVIDQSLPFETMTKVNYALNALTGAFTPYDEVAVVTYNNGPKVQTDFTAAQSARLGVMLERSKSTGREAAMNYTSGPLANNINVNDGALSHIDPNTNSTHGTQPFNTLNVPKDVHTLNDAILEAAKLTTKAGPGRRRIVYVISDGKEYGSTAKSKDVIKYLQTNKIAVWATLVGDSSVYGLGFMDRMHLPLTMRDNILPQYASQTGGQTDAEYRQGGIERSFARITEEVRTQYTIGYYTHEPFIDGKYRQLEVRVLRPNLTVIAKKGYYPTAQDAAATVKKAQ